MEKMARMHRAVIVSSMTALVLVTSSFASSFPSRKAAFCLATLKAAQERNGSTALERENTAEAIEEIRGLRIWTFRDRDARASMVRVRGVTEKSSERLRSRVASRIKGLEEYYARNATNTIQDEIVSGFTVRGRENILKFFESFEADLARMESLGAGGEKIFTRSVMSMASYGLLAMEVDGIVRAGGLSEALAVMNPVAIFGLAFGPLLLGPEYPYLILKGLDLRGTAVRAKFEKALSTIEPGAWVFDSLDYGVLEKTVNEIRQSAGFDALTEHTAIHELAADRTPWIAKASEQFAKFLDGIVGPERAARIRARNQVRAGGVPAEDLTVDADTRKAWVSTDRFLRVDEKTGEPVFSVILRASAKKPKFPAAESETEETAEWVKNLVLSPVRAPVRRNGD